eukprot:989790-Pleurochrysis_carterae.AAC.1
MHPPSRTARRAEARALAHHREPEHTSTHALTHAWVRKCLRMFSRVARARATTYSCLHTLASTRQHNRAGAHNCACARTQFFATRTRGEQQIPREVHQG